MSADAQTPDESFDQLIERHDAAGPVLTDHAVDQWVDRICCKQDDVAPWDLMDAFERAVEIGAPRKSGRARLHPPTQAVFIYTHDYSGGPPVIITVLYAWRMRLNDDHLKRCERCGLRYRDDGDDECDWCAGTVIGGRP